MEDGEVGLLGQFLKKIVSNLDIESATIQSQQMEEMIAKDWKSKLSCTLKETVQVKINKIQIGRSDFFMANV